MVQVDKDLYTFKVLDLTKNKVYSPTELLDGGEDASFFLTQDGYVAKVTKIVIDGQVKTIIEPSPLKYRPLFSLGVKDKNNNSIFEGDIIKDRGRVYAVRFTLLDYWIIEMDKFNCPTKDVEIIGNIYENQELLKRQ